MAPFLEPYLRLMNPKTFQHVFFLKDDAFPYHQRAMQSRCLNPRGNCLIIISTVFVVVKASKDVTPYQNLPLQITYPYLTSCYHPYPASCFPSFLLNHPSHPYRAFHPWLQRSHVDYSITVVIKVTVFVKVVVLVVVTCIQVYLPFPFLWDLLDLLASGPS